MDGSQVVAQIKLEGSYCIDGAKLLTKEDTMIMTMTMTLALLLQVASCYFFKRGNPLIVSRLQDLRAYR